MGNENPCSSLIPHYSSRLSGSSLGEWLAHLERLHPTTIDLGLARVDVVRQRLGLSPAFPILTIAGTNGKGSSCAMLEAILAASGYHVGCYTSPHLLRYNERVRIDGSEVDDAALCHAFGAVEAARGDVSLTYFEFGTLAAMWLFVQQKIEVAVLEVGLGGRLDAVNVFDADCAIVTSVDLDHLDYLGDDRESIGREKAGIFRSDRPAVSADPNPPFSLLRHAEDIGAGLKQLGRDFGAEPQEGQWLFWSRDGWRLSLPYPSLRGDYQLDNASACIAALETLKDKLPVTPENIRRGLLEATVPGRFQVLPGKPALILDVAHNPHAARALASNLRRMWCGGRTIAVFAMLRDKDIAGVVAALREEVDLWLVAGIAQARGADAVELLACLNGAGIEEILAFPDIASAYCHACQIAGEDDRIAAFGSFHTVAEVMQSSRNRKPD